jgi:Ca2+-transporting ATPase
MIMLLCTITVPALQKLFSFQFPGFNHFVISILSASAMLILLEVIKKVNNKSSAAIKVVKTSADS